MYEYCARIGENKRIRDMIKVIEGGVCAAKGFTANGIHAGIRKNRTKKDLALIYTATLAAAASVYTTNKVKGAPLDVTKAHISDGYAKPLFATAVMQIPAMQTGLKLRSKPASCLQTSLEFPLLT